MDDRPDHSPPPDAPDSQERATEAKLCDYLEGDLDAAGRAEIERHLAASPRHRQLVADLRRQRAALRDLPTPAAPPEVAEAVLGQVERSALLDAGRHDFAGSTVSIRWTRVLAVAAVALLAVGLTIAAIELLPGKTQTSTVALSEKLERPEPASAAPEPTTARDKPRARDLPAAPGAGGGDASAVVRAAAVPPERGLSDAITPLPPVAEAGTARAVAPLVLLVSTDDLRSADAQVKGYLTGNSIPFEVEPPQPAYVFGASPASIRLLTKLAETHLSPPARTEAMKYKSAQAAQPQQVARQQNAQLYAADESPLQGQTAAAAKDRPADERTFYARQMTLAQTHALADSLNRPAAEMGRAGATSREADLKNEATTHPAAFDVVIVLQSPAGPASEPSSQPTTLP